MKICIVFLLCIASTAPQEPKEASEKLTEHTLKASPGSSVAAEWSQLKFLQGAWAGDGFDADCDEAWSAPAGDCMLGTFRMVKDGKLRFTEFCMIDKDADGGIRMRLKHFTPAFHSWEEKDKYVSFPLVRIEKDTAYFGGLTYAKQPDGTLKIWVALEQADGSFQEVALHLKPVK